MSSDLREMVNSEPLSTVTFEEVKRVRRLSVGRVPRVELLEILNMIGIGNPVAIRMEEEAA